ncbi:OmpH family outer membrane protein [Bacteroides sp. 214]|uniref:OmpH family outer membrane protein n=1 Tax=Bacteroides sp. 214 TaxID=2302935 RepID=UPI0013D09C1F|nr:OmpH family outer membrane protein [Bacteroides sp. 214]NDW11643.1 OmpH family outer membrane protein [Bacteroides sp. 214]
MKRKNYIMNVVAAVMTIFMFAQCAGKAENPATAATVSGNGAVATSDMRIAFVDLDTLLLNYHFWNDVTEEMMKKEENVVATLNQKGRELEKEQQEFQRKHDNGAFASQERMQQEYNRIMKKQEDLQALQNRLRTELQNENAKNSVILRDSINSFLKEYNKTKGYSMIITNTGFDNLLYGDPTYNITKEIADGLNTRYTAK